MLLIKRRKKWRQPLNNYNLMNKDLRTEYVLMGKFGAAVGLKGQIKLNYYSENTALLKKHGFFINNPTEKKVEAQKLKISFVRLQKNQLVVTVEGFLDRTMVEKLCGIEIFLPRDSLPAPESSDEFYINDLIGMRVLVQNETFGEVLQIYNFGAGDIVEIKKNTGEVVMFSFTKLNFPQIKLETHEIICNPPEIMLSEKQHNSK
jgi:16S rRNA processing protein RimM